MRRALLAALIIAAFTASLSAQTTTVTADRLRLGPASVLPTTNQVRIGADQSNYCDILVGAAGNMQLDCTGSSASLLVFDALDLRGTILNGGASADLVFGDTIKWSSDATFDIGATVSTFRPRNVYVSDGINVGNGKFTTEGSAGNTLVSGTLDVRGNISDGGGTTDPVVISDANGLQITGILDVRGNISDGGGTTDPVVIDDANGLQLTGAFDVQGAITNSSGNNSGAVYVNDSFTATGATSLQSTLGVTSTTTLSSTLDVRGSISDGAGDVEINDNLDMLSAYTLGTDNYASQTTGWGISYAGGADFRYLFVDEMHAKSFIADLEQALAGGQIISKSVAMVSQQFTCPTGTGTTTLWVRDLPSMANTAAFQANDFVVLRTFSRSAGALTIADCVGTVTSYADGSSGNEGQQSWTFTRNSAGGTMTGGATVAVDALALDYGTTGNGYYEVNAIDGTYGANSPYAQVVTWATSPVAANRTVNARFGKLTGITSTSNEFGLLAGVYGTTSGCDPNCDTRKFVRLSNTNAEIHGVDLSLYDDDSANITLRGNSNNPYIAIGNPAPTSYAQTSNTGIFMGSDSGTYKLRIGTNDSGGALTAGLTWNGSTLNVIGSITVTAGNAMKTDLSNLSGGDLDDIPNGATYSRTTANQVTGAGRAYTALDSSNNLVTAAKGGVVAPVSGSGLYLGSDYMGFYDGSGTQSSSLNTYLVGYWNLNETGTNQRNDTKNTSHFNGTISGTNGTAKLGANGYYSSGCGQSAIGTYTSNVQTGDVNFTVAFWLKRVNNSYFSGHVYYWYKGSEYRIGIENETTHAPRICIGTWGTADSAPSNCLDAPTGISDTNYHLIVAGYDTDEGGGNQIFISVDGANKTTKTYATPPSSDTSNFVLADCGPAYYDELAMWKSSAGTSSAGALTNAQITELYNGGSGIAWDGSKFPDVGGGGVFKTYTDSSGNFYLGGSSGVLRWDAANSKLKVGPLNDDRLEIDASGLKFYTGTEASNLLTGSVSGTAWQIGQDAASKTYFKLDQTDGFQVIRNSAGGVDATTFKIDNTGSIWIDVENASDFTSGPNFNKLNWSVPTATGEAMIGARYLATPDYMSLLRVYTKANAFGTDDNANVQLWTEAPGSRYSRVNIEASESRGNTVKFVTDTVYLSDVSSGAGAELADEFDGYVNINDGLIVSGGIQERNRGWELGVPQAWSPTVGCSGGGCSCSIGSATYKYTLVGKTMLLWAAGTATISSASYCTLTLPTGTADGDAQCLVRLDGVSAKTNAEPALVAASGTSLNLYGTLTAGSPNGGTNLRLNCAIPIQ